MHVSIAAAGIRVCGDVRWMVDSHIKERPAQTRCSVSCRKKCWKCCTGAGSASRGRASTFSKNRERLLGGDVAQEFLEAVVSEARGKQLAER